MDIRAVIFGIAATWIGYAVWRRASHERSLMRGTATAKIGTAAKGYAEVTGRASTAVHGALRDPITHERCVWFRVVTEKFSIFDDFSWKTVKGARSSSPFVIDDGSARCLVSPGDAFIDEGKENSIVKERWNFRHRIWWIREGDPVYAIGYLQRTTDLAVQTILRPDPHDPMSPLADTRQEREITTRATEILRAWKQNPSRLRAQFDADGDGKIDSQEWDAARKAARKQAAARLRGRAAPGVAPQSGDKAADALEITHRLVKPADGRPFLLSTYGEANLVSNSRKSSFWGLVIFVFGVLTLLSLLHSCFGGG
jgi:hypothetical protein